MANVSGIVQIETGVKHDFSIAFQSVVAAQSVNVGTLVITRFKEKLECPLFFPATQNMHSHSRET